MGLIFVIIWPIGVPVLFFSLLFRGTTAARCNQPRNHFARLPVAAVGCRLLSAPAFDVGGGAARAAIQKQVAATPLMRNISILYQEYAPLS